VRSNNREYLPAVDHLRFGAAGLVVLYHAVYYLFMRASLASDPGHKSGWIYSNNPLTTFIVEGHTGVALFMVLSGFILTTGSLGRDINYRTFLRNRLLRVGPLYLVVLVIAMVVSGQRFSLSGALQTSLGFATFNGGFTGGAFDRVLWTIGVEVQFYLLFPFFLRLLNNRGPRPLVQFIALMAVLRVVAALATPGIDYSQVTYYSLVGRIDQFLIGMLAAYAFPHVRRFVGRPWVVAAALSLVAGALFTYSKVHGQVEPGMWRMVWVDVEALLWAMVLVSYVSTARFSRGRLSKALAWAGERSYGTYLLHMSLIQIVLVRGWKLDVPGGGFVDSLVTGLVVVLPCSVLFAALSFMAVEQPFLSLRRRYVNLAAVPSAPELPSPRLEPTEPAARLGVPGERERERTPERVGA
jgi:peptidoglycan/LPS O-acetylase OafA/YrhL